MFEKSKWIWIANGECADQYAEFCDSVSFDGKRTMLRISCDSDYTLYINENFASCGQYGDFEHYKIYDDVDITEYLKNGKNDVRILVYHCGVATSRYRPAQAGLIYEVICESEIIAHSSEKTLSRLCPTYASGKQVFVSDQLGFTFFYDATKANDAGYIPSSRINKQCEFYPRPIKKHRLFERREIKSVTALCGNRLLIDLGAETVGLPTLDIVSDREQTLTIAWGEHIFDGSVKKQIGRRNFFFEYKTTKGHNVFTEYMLRIGCRYLEIEYESPIELNYAGVIPQTYEVEPIPCRIDGQLENDIYNICINTLRLCMMEHYVDCPWREQALYAFDSRNQMLCGYHSFADKNAEYARANLRLIGMDRRADGLLSICYPCGVDAAIPSFSLYYILAMKEYIEHTGDTSLAEEMFEKMTGIIDEFLKNERNGLIAKFPDGRMWNFYDWSKYSEGSAKRYGQYSTDLAINCLCVIALDSFEYICAGLKREFPYAFKADNIRENVRKAFLAPNGLYTMHQGEEHFTVIGNTLCLLAGVAKESERAEICEALIGGTMIDCSLSMKVLEYEALLMTDTEKYRDAVLSEIKKNYKKMLDAGADTVWETIDGEADFGGAGSLCHGWSAIPVYIYHKLGIAKELN